MLVISLAWRGLSPTHKDRNNLRRGIVPGRPRLENTGFQVSERDLCGNQRENSFPDNHDLTNQTIPPLPPHLSHSPALSPSMSLYTSAWCIPQRKDRRGNNGCLRAFFHPGSSRQPFLFTG